MYFLYLCYFAAEGILYPFWPTWLKSQGYSNSEVSLFIAAAYWPQVFAGFVLTYLADWHIGQLRAAAWIASLSTVCLCLYYLPNSVALFIVLGIMYGGLWPTVLPLSEAYLLNQNKSKKYGHVRAIGSLSFISLSVGTGVLTNQFGQQLVPGLIAFFMLLTAFSCHFLQNLQIHVTSLPIAKPRPNWKLLLRESYLLMAIVASGLIQLSHCLYFATASNHWVNQGYSTTVIGLLWALSVIAEISYFAISDIAILQRSPMIVIMFSGLFAAIRWGLFAMNGGILWVVISQLMHAVSFAAYHAALMVIIRENAPKGMQTFTQGVYYSLAVALPMGIMMPIAGWLFDIASSMAYLVMVFVALSGAIVAYFANKKKGVLCVA